MRVLIFVLTLLLFTPFLTVPALQAFAAEEGLYICPMHPHIHGKKGEHCPICGMELVPAPSSSSAPMSLPPDGGRESGGGIAIDPAYRQALGVRAAPAAMHDFGSEIHVFGRIEASTRREHAVATRTAGWVVEIKADAEGDAVKKGDMLYAFYSPDLMSAQTDYFLEKRGRNRAGNAERRLRLSGMDDQAIAALNKSGKMMERTPFYAPSDGIVSMLNARKGSYVNEGDIIMRLQDYSDLWLMAEADVKDVPLLSPGMPVRAKVSGAGDEYDGTVDIIFPIANEMSRKVMVRAVLPNPEGRLKPGQYADVTFEAGKSPRLAVPSEAVLYDGAGAHVIESLADGSFRPVMVKTGITAHGMTEILSGLEENRSVVVSGQFMIDAESSLRGGMAAMGHDHGQ